MNSYKLWYIHTSMHHKLWTRCSTLWTSRAYMRIRNIALNFHDLLITEANLNVFLKHDFSHGHVTLLTKYFSEGLHIGLPKFELNVPTYAVATQHDSVHYSWHTISCIGLLPRECIHSSRCDTVFSCISQVRSTKGSDLFLFTSFTSHLSAQIFWRDISCKGPMPIYSCTRMP